MVCIDGFYISHTYEPVEINEDAGSFIGEYQIPEINGLRMELNPKNPVTQGSYASPENYQEFKKAQQDAMEQAKGIIKEVNREFGKKYGRSYGDGLVQTYNMEKAKHAIITMGSITGTIKYLMDSGRIRDIGLVKIRSFRPFPEKELSKIISGLSSVGVLEKDISVGNAGALFTEVRAAADIPVSNFVGGLGGRDITPPEIGDIFSIIRKKDEGFHWVGSR
jgi:pyruvate ferredoxin oxidoreductase alpha subunit